MMPLDAPSPPSADSAPVGLIGLGLMGSAMAEALGRGGFSVVGYDRVPERLAAAQAGGVVAAKDSRAVVARCPRVVLSLFDGGDVRSLLEDVHSQLQPGQILVDTTTGAAEDAEATGAWLERLGVSYVSATLSGNSEQVRRREVTVMAGGPAEAVAACTDLFDALAASWFHVGGWGTAALMKLVTNLVLGLNRAALAEGLVFARAMGIDAARALEVMKSSPAYSRMMDVKGAKMLAGDFEPQARLSQHLKDVRLMIEAAARTGQRLPLTEAHRGLLEQAERLGLGEADNSAVLRAIENPAPTEP